MALALDDNSLSSNQNINRFLQIDVIINLIDELQPLHKWIFELSFYN